MSVDYQKLKTPQGVRVRGTKFQIRIGIKKGNGQKENYTRTFEFPPSIKCNADAEEFMKQVYYEQYIRCGKMPKKSFLTLKEFIPIFVINYAEKMLKKSTVASYKGMIPRVEEGLGHILLRDLTAVHIETFLLQLIGEDVRADATFKPTDKLIKLANSIPRKDKNLLETIGISRTTILSITRGNPVSYQSMIRLCNYYSDFKQKELFTPTSNKVSLSAKSVLNYKTFISSVLDYAFRGNYVSENVCRRVKKMRRSTNHYVGLEQNEITRIQEALDKCTDKQFVTEIYFLMMTGARRGEMLGIKWKYINFEKSTVTIKDTVMYRQEYGVYIDTTKNNKERTIHISSDLCKRLKELKIEQDAKVSELKEWNNEGWVFPSKKGIAMNPDTFSVKLRRFKNMNGLNDVDLFSHKLRHTFATELLKMGTPVIFVSQALGHSSVDVTTKAYIDAIPISDSINLSQQMQKLLETKEKSEEAPI